MDSAPEEVTTRQAGELEDLFFQRTRICLWLGIVFFSLFALLDFICCRPHFSYFFFLRFCFVLLLFALILLLTLPQVRGQTRAVMYSAMLLGALIISLMTIQLGGFASGYYVGILLMIAGGFSVLPLDVRQALLLGGAMYLVYVLTVYLGSRPLDDQALVHGVTNSFFFFIIVIVTAIQCFDDLHIQKQSLRAQKGLRALNDELKHYTGNLEAMIRRRMELLEESDLRFHDLYNNILDMVVQIDRTGRIGMINRHGAAFLDSTPDELQGRSLTDFLLPGEQDHLVPNLLDTLSSGNPIRGLQMRMLSRQNRIMEVELSGNRVDTPESEIQFQLVVRDITATKEIERRVLESSQLIDTSRQAAIFGLARLAECRDDDTGTHLMRIREYTRILAVELARNIEFAEIVTATFIEDLCLSSVLHDIGKVGIPDTILLKPNQLSPAEFKTMMRHCEYGSMALSAAEKDSASLSFLRMGQEITLFHHERWDGQGYPHGLAGTQIPLSARIVTLADVYDALTSNRPYKPAFSHQQAREILIRESGIRFDPAIVNAFLAREEDFQAARDKLQASYHPGNPPSS
ncbi:HD domain-containing phosphohydrolase [Desulfobulbus alkaliphilus]|uniref:HD domain-containing phosphohydrolase n=1 Tax=Desulfobulbus alkaliphilus TaxID=869814 RepID=UPI001966C3D1|nr:HD domain-containing phosphohydrolase [Desulfobulbus alkaliphilus]MBM9538378.1 HD domain-containing protein [Desulfobulbus alkaliphilus]